MQTASSLLLMTALLSKKAEAHLKLLVTKACLRFFFSLRSIYFSYHAAKVGNLIFHFW